MTYFILSCIGCEEGALNTSPFVWHLTQVKSIFPPTVCLEFLPSDENEFTLVPELSLLQLLLLAVAGSHHSLVFS